MDKIIRRISGSPMAFSVYTREEAREKGIKWVHWRVAKGGDWAISDDGYIALCIKRKTYTDRTNHSRACIYLAHGTIWLSKGAHFSYIERKEKNAFSSSSARTWIDKEARSGRAKRAIRAYVDMLLHYKKIDWDKLGQIYRPNQADPSLTAKRLFRMPKIMELVHVEVENALSKLKIDRGRVAEMMMETYETAQANNKTSDMARITDNFAKMLQMYTPKADKVSNNQLPTGEFTVLDVLVDEMKKDGLIEGEESKKITKGKEDG